MAHDGITKADRADVVVVGAGAAGLYAALVAAREGAQVALVSRSPLAESASYWAQGGIAAALAEDDSPALHLEDTLAHKSFDAIWPIVKPIFLGSLPLGLVTGLVSYFIVRAAVQAYQNSRRERLEARRLSRLSEAEGT